MEKSLNSPAVRFFRIWVFWKIARVSMIEGSCFWPLHLYIKVVQFLKRTSITVRRVFILYTGLIFFIIFSLFFCFLKLLKRKNHFILKNRIQNSPILTILLIHIETIQSVFHFYVIVHDLSIYVDCIDFPGIQVLTHLHPLTQLTIVLPHIIILNWFSQFHKSDLLIINSVVTKICFGFHFILLMPSGIKDNSLVAVIEINSHFLSPSNNIFFAKRLAAEWTIFLPHQPILQTFIVQ